MRMKLKRWLALGLSVALVLFALYGQSQTVWAEETGEGPEVTEAEKPNEEEEPKENQLQSEEQGTEDGETPEAAPSEGAGGGY